MAKYLLHTVTTPFLTLAHLSLSVQLDPSYDEGLGGRWASEFVFEPTRGWRGDPAAPIWVALDVPLQERGVFIGATRYVLSGLAGLDQLLMAIETSLVEQVLQGVRPIPDVPPWAAVQTSSPLRHLQKLARPSMPIPGPLQDLPYLPLAQWLWGVELGRWTVAGDLAFWVDADRCQAIVHRGNETYRLDLPRYWRSGDVIRTLLDAGLVPPSQVPPHLVEVQGNPALELRHRRSFVDGTVLYERRLLGTVVDYALVGVDGTFSLNPSWRGLLAR